MIDLDKLFDIASKRPGFEIHRVRPYVYELRWQWLAGDHHTARTYCRKIQIDSAMPDALLRLSEVVKNDEYWRP